MIPIYLIILSFYLAYLADVGFDDSSRRGAIAITILTIISNVIAVFSLVTFLIELI